MRLGKAVVRVNAFSILGVRPNATPDEIRSAYRRRARVLHPDRHVLPDGTVPEAAQRAFVELNQAFEAALAERAGWPTQGAAARTGPARVPAQRAVRLVAPPPARTPRGATSVVPGPRPASAPRLRPTPTPAPRPPAPRRPADPVETLLTLPQDCLGTWSVDELEFWASSVVPAARARLAAAHRAAETAGPISGADTTNAAAHALLTLALASLSGRRRLDPARIAEAYDVLESRLPRTVLAGLPPRVPRLPLSRALARVGLGGLAVLAAAALTVPADWTATLLG